MTGDVAARESSQIDALVTDRYLDSLLAAHGRGADHAPVSSVPRAPLRSIADRLAHDLPRYHPSFRFEEALAARLDAVARAMRSSPELALASVQAGSDMSSDGWQDQLHRPMLAAIGRPWIVGGALTSALLSVAGAAYIAWRHARPATRSRSI